MELKKIFSIIMMTILCLTLQAGRCNIRLNGTADDLFSVPFEGISRADIFDSYAPLLYMKNGRYFPVSTGDLTPGLGYFNVDFDPPRDLYIVTIEGTEPSEI